MRIISNGYIELDYFFKNDIFVGYQIGGVAYNTLVNINKKYDVLYNYIGNLDNINPVINVNKLKEHDNKKVFITRDGYTSICPYCNRMSKFNYDSINYSYEDDDILLLDTLDKIDCNNKKHLIIKYISLAEKYSLDELYDLLSNYETIIINKNVYDYLRSKFKIDYDDIYQNINVTILIIFNGNKGSIIECNNIIYEKEVEEEIYEINKNGGLEAFYGTFLSCFLDCTIYDEKFISFAYMKAMINYNLATSTLGNYTHIESLKKIDNYKECICS